MTNQQFISTSRARSVFLVCVAFIVFNMVAQSQIFTIKRIEQSTDELTIVYDLEDTGKPRAYFVQVFSSTDQFSKPLLHVNGDVGINIVAGINRKIVWKLKSDLGDFFVGDIQLEVRGKIYEPFIVLDEIGGNRTIKRGKKTRMAWRGDLNKKDLVFSLFNNNEEMIETIPNIANIGKADITLSRKLKPGPGYYFVISESSDPKHIVRTDEFVVKKRFPLVVKLVPAIVVLGTVILLLPEKPSDSVGVPVGPPSGK